MEHYYGVFIHAWRGFEIYNAYTGYTVLYCSMRYVADYNLNPDVIIIKLSLMNISSVIRVEDVYV